MENISATNVQPENTWEPVVSKAYEYLSSDKPQVNQTSDKDNDMQVVDFISAGLRDRVPMNTILKDSQRPEYNRGLYSKYLKSLNPDMEMSDIYDVVGAGSQSRDIMTQGPVGRFAEGAKADYQQVAYGVRETMLPENDALQEERKMNIKGYEDANEFRKGASVEYSPEGEANEKWNVAGGLGEAAIDVGVGYGAGKAYKGVIKMGVADTVASTALETARYQEHGDKTRLALGIGSSIAGNLVGNWLAPAGKQGVGETKSVAELDEQLKFLEMFQKNDIPISAEILNNPIALKDKITETIKNPFERKRMLATVDEMQEGLIGQLDTSLKQLGVDPVKFAGFKNGEVSEHEMGQVFQDYLKAEKQNFRLKENALYNEAKKVDINPETGTEYRYPIASLMEEMKVKLAGSPEAFSVVQNEMRHLGRLESAESIAVKEAQDGFEAVEGGLSKRFTKTVNDITKLEGDTDKWISQLQVLRQRMSEVTENTKDSTIMKLQNDIRATKANIDKAKVDLKSLRGSKGGLVAGLERVQKDMDALRGPLSKAKDPEYLTANELALLKRRVSEKINNAGGIVSLSDQNTIGALTQANKATSEFMNKNIKHTNYMDIQSKANDVARQRFDLTGKTSKIANVAKAIDNNNPEAMYALVKSDTEGYNNLLEMKKLMGEDNQMYKSLVNKKYSDQVMDGVRQATGVDELAGIDMEKLASNLNKKGLISEIENTAGKEIADVFRGLKYMSNAYGQTYSEMIKHKPAIKGGEYGFFKTPKDLISTMFKDLSEIATGDAYTPRWYAKKADMNEAIATTKGRMAKAKTPEEKKEVLDSLGTQLGNLVKGKELSGSMVKEGATTVIGGTAGGAAGYASAPEGQELEYATAGALVGAGMAKAVGKGVKGYKSGEANMLAGPEYAEQIGKMDEYFEASVMSAKGKSSKEIYKKTGMIDLNGDIHTPVHDFVEKIELSAIEDYPKTLREVMKDPNDPLLKAHPDLGDLEIYIDDTLKEGEGYFMPGKNRIAVSRNYEGIGHEAQHGFDKAYGHPGGGNPDILAKPEEAKKVLAHFLDSFAPTDFKPEYEEVLLKAFQNPEISKAHSGLLDKADRELLNDALSEMQYQFNKANKGQTDNWEVGNAFEALLPFNRYTNLPGERKAVMADDIAEGFDPTFTQYGVDKEPVSKAYINKQGPLNPVKVQNNKISR